MQPVQRHVAIHCFIDVERSGDRLIVSGVKPEWPEVLCKKFDDGLQFLLHNGSKIRAWLKKVFEIGGREDKHFAGAVVPEEVVPLSRLEHAAPTLEIRQLPPGFLGEKVVCDPDSQVTASMQLIDDLVVFGIVLESASRVDCACDAQPVQFPHKVPC